MSQRGPPVKKKLVYAFITICKGTLLVEVEQDFIDGLAPWTR
jgi:hypothetical protein